MLVFSGGRKTGEPGEKPSEQDENQQQTQPTYDTGPELNPGNPNSPSPHWWGASVLSTAPFLLPYDRTMIERVESILKFNCDLLFVSGVA